MEASGEHLHAQGRTLVLRCSSKYFKKSAFEIIFTKRGHSENLAVMLELYLRPFDPLKSPSTLLQATHAQKNEYQP